MSESFDASLRAIRELYEREAEDRRQRRVERARLYFRVHLAVYLATQALLVATWALVAHVTGFGFPWFVFPLLGWAIGVAAHFVVSRSPGLLTD